MDEEYGAINWDAEYGNDPTVLEPFNQTMADSVNATGTLGNPVTPKTSGLSDIFHQLIVAPDGGVQTGSTVGNILNYFSKTLVTPPQTQQQTVTQNGLNRVLYGGTTSSNMFSNPLLWVGIVAAIVLVIFVVVKLRK